jgi:glycosyltransferase involved in cell wall biosynthesis
MPLRHRRRLTEVGGASHGEDDTDFRRHPVTNSGNGTRASRRLLFHTYHFPPIGGSGAQRPLKMVRALRELGYESLVVTRAGATTNRWAPEDATLIDEIPADIEVRRISSDDEPQPTTRRQHLAENWLRIEPPWSRWWVDRTSQLGVEVGSDIELVYVWMQPYASAMAGVRLSRTLGRPWVADLGDPWALDEMMVYPSSLHRKAELRRMHRLLRTASAIVMSTEEAVRRLLAEFPDLDDRPVVAIPNGFDAADFTGAPSRRNDGKFRILHSGYLHTDLGNRHRARGALRRSLGGSVPGLDILTRSHVYLVEAVRRLLEDPALAGVLELHLAGVMNAEDLAVAARCPATLHGYLSHRDAIALMRSSDLLFLPMQNLPPGARATIVPGKTYEYLAAESPILAAVPDGDARDILARAGGVFLVRPDDVDGMVETIRQQVARHRAGLLPPSRDTAFVDQFEYRHLAAQLAATFDRVLVRRGAVTDSL